MKNICFLPLLLLNFIINAQDLEGSWKLIEENGIEVTDKEVVRIYQDGYFAEAAKDVESNSFLWAQGGEFIENDYQERPDFNTKDSEVIGHTFDPELKFKNDGKTMEINNVSKIQVWERISDNTNELSGNWVITGRKNGNELRKMTPGDRRTVKILGGDRFQWIAFNSATKEFFGTGGGSYSAEDGKYTENIEVFSRDSSRVGARLNFQYEVKEGEWHHRGKSSKGEPIFEIWSPYAKAYHR